jgi:hypothetical protein
MKGIDICAICGVPTMVSGGLNWDANGAITLASSPKNRMVFIESETIDHLFNGIEELIGMPIGHIVIESRSRETRRYIERAFPPEMRSAVERMGAAKEEGGPAMPAEERETTLATIKAITDSVIAISRVYGYGDQRPSDLWESGGDYPWRTQVISNPYSLLCIAADNLGSVEACEGVSMRVKYSETGENTYRIEVYPGEHSIGLKERLRRKHYELKPGDIVYERCPECGIPLEAARRKWDLREGICTDPDTGRRMAIFGPSALEAVLDDLESEVGEAVQEAAIEAQRRYIKMAWGVDQWNRAGATFQQMMAVRGMGNLVGFEGDTTHLTLTIENSCLHLAMVGTIQALVELVYKVEHSTCEWELAEDGDLTMTVKVK